jgi:D-arabinose 1-dehydrogenase-like Zn-dependent alcohol dehydrogenase
MSAKQSGREYLYEALDYVAKGKVRVMTETFPLDDIADAYERADNGMFISVQCKYELAVATNHLAIT